MITMRYNIRISRILNNVWSIKNIAIICCITALSSSCCYFIAYFRNIMTMFLLLTINLFLTANIIRTSYIFQINIILSINLDNISTLDFIDNILSPKLIVGIFHQKIFAENSIIWNFPIIIMIVITMRSDITLISNFDNNLLRVNPLFFAYFVRR